MQIDSPRKGRRRPTLEEGPAVTSRRIVDVAYEIARKEGLPAIQIRRVASELGVWPQALYHHVPNKTRLLELVADRALGTRRPLALPASAPWNDRLKDLADSVTEAFGRFTGLAEFVVTQPNFIWSDEISSIADQALAILFEAGLQPLEALAMFASLSALILGESQLRAIGALSPPADPKPQIDAATFPNVARAVETASEAPDVLLANSVHTFIDGIAARNPPHRREKRS
jgi:AcrR family transcriptional regulator